MPFLSNATRSNRTLRLLLVLSTMTAALAMGSAQASECSASISAQFPNPSSSPGTHEISISDSVGRYSKRVAFGQTAAFEKLACGEIRVTLWTSYGDHWFPSGWTYTQRAKLSREEPNLISLDVPGVPIHIASVDGDWQPSPMIHLSFEASDRAFEDTFWPQLGFLDGQGKAQTLLYPNRYYLLRILTRGGDSQLYVNDQRVEPERQDETSMTFRIHAESTPIRVRVETEHTKSVPLVVELENGAPDESVRIHVKSENGSQSVTVPWNRTIDLPIGEFPATVRPYTLTNHELEFDPPEIELLNGDRTEPIRFTARVEPPMKKPGRLIGEDLEAVTLRASWRNSDGCSFWTGGKIQADRDGSFEMPCRANCRMRLSVPGFGPYSPASWSEEVSECESPIEIVLEPKQAPQYLNGTVVSAKDEPVVGLPVAHDTNGSIFRVTSEEGTFRFAFSSRLLRLVQDDASSDFVDPILVDAKSGYVESYAPPEEGDLDVTLLYQEGSRFCVQDRRPDRFVIQTVSLDRADLPGEGFREWDAPGEPQACTAPLVAGLYKVRYAALNDSMPVWWPSAYSREQGASLQLVAGERSQLTFPEIPAAKLKLKDWGSCGFKGWTHLRHCRIDNESAEQAEPQCVDIDLKRFSERTRSATIQIPVGPAQLSLVQRDRGTTVREMTLKSVAPARGEQLEIYLRDHAVEFIAALFTPAPTGAGEAAE